MSDFVVAVGNDVPCSVLAERLEDIPSTNAGVSSVATFPWGAVAVRPPVSDRLQPAKNNRKFGLAVGRPILRGKKTTAQSLCQHATDEFAKAGHPVGFLAQLSGVFAIVVAGPQTLNVVTDPMGCLPVYASASGEGLVVGSHPEVVAEVAGISEEFDQVSLAQMVLEDRITFPYTTRRGMRELGPGRFYDVCIEADVGNIDKAFDGTPYWLPTEPETFQPLDQLRDQLYSGFLEAAADFTRGGSIPTVLLSGGTDCRAIVGAFQSLPDAPVVRALTFADHENRELRCARTVANTADIPHTIVWRSLEHYATILDEATELIGFERCTQHAHTLGLLPDETDASLFVGGMGADSLLKGYYDWRTPVKVLGERVVPGFKNEVRDRYFYQELLCKNSIFPDELIDRIAARKWQRFQELQRLRPTSALEWSLTYPASRRKATGFTHVGMRTAQFDEFFHHRALLDVAASADSWSKLSRRLTEPVYYNLAPDLAELRDSNNRLPGTAHWTLRQSYKFLAKIRRVVQQHWSSIFPGNNNEVQTEFEEWRSKGPWVEFDQYYRHSPKWTEYRDAILEKPGTELLQWVCETAEISDFFGPATPVPGQQQYRLAQITMLGNVTLDTESRASQLRKKRSA